MKSSYRSAIVVMFAATLLYVALSQSAIAQSNGATKGTANSADPVDLSFWNRPGLFDGDSSPFATLRESGVDLNVSWTEYGQGLLAGKGEHQWQFGGKFFGKLNLDGAKLGLWRGLSISAIGEYMQGDSADAVARTLLPTNTALYGPADGKPGGDLSLNVRQEFGRGISLAFGKFNMYEAPSHTPILGGGGLDGFWNLGLAAPFTGVVPPYITGFSLGIRTRPAQISLMIYNPNNAQKNTGLRYWGQQGITARLGVTLPLKLAGHIGYHGITFVGSSKKGTDFADIPNLILPPDARPALGTKTGSFYGAYSLQQYLWQNPNRPEAGWGIFGQIGIGDSNPNPLAWMMLVGTSGTGVIPKRPLDRFGIGYFRYAVSQELVNGLQVLGVSVRPEQGGEMYYTLAAARWFRVTADFQIIQSGYKSMGTPVVAGLSAQVRF